MKNEWFQFERVSKNAKAALFCFPCAGGSPFEYATWSKHLREEIDVYPLTMAGRNKRAEEAYADSIESASAEFASGIQEQIGKKIILAGHSMGGLLAYQTAYLLEQQYHISCEKVVLMASRPDLRESLQKEYGAWDQMDDGSFGKLLLQFGAVEKRILKMSIFQSQFLPVIRSDFSLLARYVPNAKIQADFEIYYGDQDRLITREDCEQWKKYTSGKVQIHKQAGDHFFLKYCVSEICDDMNRCI